MSFIVIMKKITALILSAITPLLMCISFEPTAKYDSECQTFIEKTDGFIKGVCNSENDYEMINECNIGWVRMDIPFPYDRQGNISLSYLAWKEEMKGYVDNGIKIFAVTPCPTDYIDYGLDPRDESAKEGICDIARFFVEDLKGLVGAFQIANEMGIDRFTLPLTLDEAAEFIGIQLEAMYPIRGDIVIGYNLAGFSVVTLPFKMSKWHKYCDYVGLDMYLGSFEDISKEINQYLIILGFVRKITGKPIVMCEFGYIGYGEPKTEDEKAEILRYYGYNSEEEASADIDNFISKLPEKLGREISELYPDYTAQQKAEIIFNGEYTNHLYCSLPEGYGLNGYSHTPEGQGEFFADLIPKMMKYDYIVGAIIYCWEDSGRCYVCGQSDCPVETGWGLVDGDGNAKPAYYAVQKAFAE